MYAARSRTLRIIALHLSVNHVTRVQVGLEDLEETAENLTMGKVDGVELERTEEVVNSMAIVFGGFLRDQGGGNNKGWEVL